MNETKPSAKAESAGSTARHEAGKARETIAGEAKAVAGQAKELGREHAERQFEHGKHTVEEQVDAVGSAVDDAAQRLRRENNPLASYAEELSGQLSRFSSGIENTSLDELAVKARRVARDNPGLFMLGSVVAGLAAARFFKASAEKERSDREYDPEGRAYGRQGYGDDAGRGGSAYGSAGYRSPTASVEQPYRDSGVTSADTVSSAAGTAADRVPFDSDTTGRSGSTGTGAGVATTNPPASTPLTGTDPNATGSDNAGSDNNGVK